MYMYSRSHNQEFYSPLQSDEHVEAEMDTDEFEEILRVSADAVCRDEIGEEYIRKSYRHADIMLMMLNLSGEEIQMDGFIFAHEHEDMYGNAAIDLDIICARHFGGLLLEKFIRYCQTLGGYKYIELSALPNVIGFYTRYGFAFRGDCNPRHAVDYVVTPEVSDALRRIHDNAARNPIVANVLHSLHRLGYTPLTTPFGCYDTTITRSEYLTHGCHRNGLEMRLCLEERDTDIISNKAADKRAAAIQKLDDMIRRDDEVMDELEASGELDYATRLRIMQHRRTAQRYREQLEYALNNSNSKNSNNSESKHYDSNNSDSKHSDNSNY